MRHRVRGAGGMDVSPIHNRSGSGDGSGSLFVGSRCSLRWLDELFPAAYPLWERDFPCAVWRRADRRPFPQKRRLESVVILLSLGVSEVVNEILKLIFARPRPVGFNLIDLPDSFSFPSGHAMIAPGFYLMLALLIARWYEEKVGRHTYSLSCLFSLCCLPRAACTWACTF